MNSAQFKAFRLVLNARAEALISKHCSAAMSPEEESLNARVRELQNQIHKLRDKRYHSTDANRSLIKKRVQEIELEALMGTLDSDAIKTLDLLSQWDPTAQGGADAIADVFASAGFPLANCDEYEDEPAPLLGYVPPDTPLDRKLRGLDS